MLKKLSVSKGSEKGEGENEKYDKTITFIDLLNSSKITEVSQEFWADFLAQFEFLYDELYNKLALTDQIVLLVNNYCKDVFNWAISNQL